MQGVLYDITDYKRFEEQLRKAQKMEAIHGHASRANRNGNHFNVQSFFIANPRTYSTTLSRDKPRLDNASGQSSLKQSSLKLCSTDAVSTDLMEARGSSHGSASSQGHPAGCGRAKCSPQYCNGIPMRSLD